MSTATAASPAPLWAPRSQFMEIDGDAQAFVYDDVAKARTVFEWGDFKPGQGDKRSSIPESREAH